ncbi:MAG: hypothetical protein ABI454_05300 [Sphingomicrobium sp.]
MTEVREGRLDRMAPALLLAFLAPMFAEVLPGATRFSSIFVLPIEIAVWGGGAVLARALARTRGLGWWSLLLLGMALSVAEEFLIQQTSVAPMVIRLKGETWGRAFGLNYIYFLWALAYESIWVVLLPTLTTELIFAKRRTEPWLSKAGAIVTGALFAIACFLAWFTWTQIARTKVFHQPPYTPPLAWSAAAATAIALLFVAALRFPPKVRRGLVPPPRWIVGLLGAVWAVLWFGLVVLAFGVDPQFPEIGAGSGGLIVIAFLLYFVPRWAAHPRWSRGHAFALIAGSLTGSMAVSFVGFIGSASNDLWFKVIVDVAAVTGLLWLGRRVSRSFERQGTAS